MASPRPAVPEYSHLYKDAKAHVHISDKDIRLVALLPGSFDQEVRCTLDVASLDEERYEALSYTWGTGPKPDASDEGWEDVDSDDDAAEDVVDLIGIAKTVDAPESQPVICVNETLVPVMPNLLQALRHLRDARQTRILWIDYLCINQGSIADRNNQVRRMDLIYKSATKVLIWLGPQSDDSDAALHVIEAMNSHSHLTDIYDSEWPKGLPHALRSLVNLLSRPWWSRIWVVQEAVLAREAMVYIGERSMPWDWFVIAGQVFRSHISCCASVISPAVLTDESDVYYQVRAVWADVLALTAFSRLDPSLHHALRWTYSREATDPRDKVFGLLGLLPPEKRLLQADYEKAAEDVYEETAVRIIQNSGSLSVLMDIDEKAGQVNETPSWAPDWTLVGIDAVNLEDYFRASGSVPAMASQCGPHALRTCAIRVDDISASYDTGLDDESDHTLVRAYRRLQKWEAMAGGPVMPMSGVLPGDLSRPEYRDFWLDVRPYLSGEAREDAFWRTVMMGLSADRSRRLVDSDFIDYQCWRDWLSQLDNTPPDSIEDMLEQMEDYQSFYDHNLMLTNYVAVRSFFLTDDGLMGMGPEETSPDFDMIAVLAGGKMPFVLRPITAPCDNCTDTEGQFQLMGWAYVHGIMDGETVREIEKDLCSWQEMCLI